MLLDAPTPGSPEDWLRHARNDLALAQQRQGPEVLLAALCLHAQQAVEKGLKAVLIQRGVAFPYMHDLARSITLVQSGGLPWPEELEAAAGLAHGSLSMAHPAMVRRRAMPFSISRQWCSPSWIAC
jgi:HEPN domain-containing protein